jgi:ribosome modulation factor
MNGAQWTPAQLRARRFNGWRDAEPDRICMHGVNISVRGDCIECSAATAKLTERAPLKVPTSSDYERGYGAGYKAGRRAAATEETP